MREQYRNREDIVETAEYAGGVPDRPTRELSVVVPRTRDISTSTTE
jgi:hypothetical protein